MTENALVPCDAVLFDCDGVLVDSDASVAAAWSEWAERLGFDPEAVVATVHGRRSADTVAAWVRAGDRVSAQRLIDSLELASATSVTAIPGATALIASIPPARVAIVTSGTRALARARLQAAGIAEPGVLVTAGDVERGKPAPDGYRLAAERLGVSPARCVVVEDAPAGVRAGRAAGAGYVLGVDGSGRLTEGRSGERDGETPDACEVDWLVGDLTSVHWTGSGLQVAPSGHALFTPDAGQP